VGRKTRWVAASAAIAIVAAGAVFLSHPRSDPSGPGRAAGMPAPPPGMRWVGYADEVVAVPTAWTTGDAPCNQPQSDTVYLAFPGQFFCVSPAAPPGVSSVRIYPATSGPHFTVESPDSRLEEQIQRSHREVPDGWTTVPWRGYGSALAFLKELSSAGLQGELVKEYVLETDDGRSHTIPSAGSPVRRDTTITLVVGVHRSMVIRQGFASPGDVLDVEFPEGTPSGDNYLMALQSSPRLTPSYRLSPSSLDQPTIPDEAGPGLYRICLVDHGDQSVCDVVRVVA
jgi:hypothetical protein